MSDATPAPPPYGDGSPTEPPAPPAQPGYGTPQAPPAYGAPGAQVPPAYPGTAGYPGTPTYPGAPAYAAAPMPAPVSVRPLRGIGGATKWLILVSAALTLITIAVDASGLGAIGSITSGTVTQDALNAYDILSGLVALITGAATMAGAICWLVWQHRAASSVPPTALRRSPGWHVGSWFIPVIALWFPFQNIKDLTAAARTNLSAGIRGVWWGLWIGSSVIYGISNSQMQSARTPDAVTSALSMSIVGDLLWIAAAVFAWIIVTRITDALDPARR